MKKAYVSPEAIRVNFEANDIITASGILSTYVWNGWDGEGVMSITWSKLVDTSSDGGDAE